jgi:calcineurin-like phosphoesterase family protein
MIALARDCLTGWSSVQPYAEIEVDGFGIVLCHYAFRAWRNMSRGWLNLHGHSYGRLVPLPRQMDASVDAQFWGTVRRLQAGTIEIQMGAYPRQRCAYSCIHPTSVRA